jgi:hypothetical protein
MVLKAHNLPIIVLGGWGAESPQVANNHVGRVVCCKLTSCQKSCWEGMVLKAHNSPIIMLKGGLLKAHKLSIIMLAGWGAESSQVANNHVGRVGC